MKTKHMAIILLAAVLLVSVFTNNAFATIVNGKVLYKTGYVEDPSVSVNLGSYSCYYSYKTSNHRLLFDINIDPINATGTMASCKMNYSVKALNETYSNLHNLYISSGGGMSEEQFMLNAGASLAGTVVGSYSGSWSTTSDTQSGYYSISDNKLVYLHHVFYGKVGSTYSGISTFNAACAIPSNYSGIKYYY